MKRIGSLSVIFPFLFLLMFISCTDGASRAGQTGERKPAGTHMADTFSSASGSTSTSLQSAGSSVAVIPIDTGFKELFEGGSKRSYATGSVSFGSGEWLLDDALTGSLVTDPKIGSQAIRIRNHGRLSMQFDIKNAGQVSITFGFFGADASCDWQLWSSKNQGRTYSQSGDTQSGTGERPAVFNLAITGPVRFEIRKLGKGKSRLEIESFSVTSTGSLASAGSLAAGSQASVSTTGSTALPSIGSGSHVSLASAASGSSRASSSSSYGPANSTASRPLSPEEVQDNNPLLPGNPSDATTTGSPDNYLIDHSWYIESYNRSRAEPNWVCWHLSVSDLGTTDRLNDFRPDTRLPNGWYEVDNTSYRSSGFDRGHNCPSGDRTSSAEANSSTFLMDNMIPQAPNNNQHTWEHLEEYCRTQVRRGKEAYIIMGSYGTGGTGRNGYAISIDGGRVNVPAHIWKVIILLPDGMNDLSRIDATSRIIAVDTPNRNDLAPDFMKYICTIADLERATGYKLLSRVPEPLRSRLENVRFRGGD